MAEMVMHDCPIDGIIEVESECECNWCGEVVSKSDDQKSSEIK